MLFQEQLALLITITQKKEIPLTLSCARRHRANKSSHESATEVLIFDALSSSNLLQSQALSLHVNRFSHAYRIKLIFARE